MVFWGLLISDLHEDYLYKRQVDKAFAQNMDSGTTIRILCSWKRCRANMAHVRQSWPHSGLGFKVNVLTTREVLLGNALQTAPRALERLRENLADFVRNISRIHENLYQDVT